MYAGGESRGNGGGRDGGRDALLGRRRQPGPSSSSSSSGAAAAAASSSSSGRGEEGEEEGGGGGKKQGMRKKQGKREAAVKAIRGGLPAAAASCWRCVSVVQEAGGRMSRRSRRWEKAANGSGHGCGGAGEDGSGPAGTALASAAAWCCVSPGADCSLEPNPSANGKEDSGVRSLLERNDFFSAECNPHADAIPAAAASS